MNTKFKLSSHFKNFHDFILNIKNYFDISHDTIHKARNELKIIPHNDLNVVVKAFKVPNIINRIAYSYLRDSKAKKSYEYSLKIASFTPEPIGYIEFYKHKLLKESYFLSEKFPYDFTIREPLLESDFKNRDAIFRAFSRFTYDLHTAGIFHNDYSPGNILIQKDGDNYVFKVVDINRMKFFDGIKMTQTERAKNFSKLWANDTILEVMADEYQKFYDSDEEFTTQVLYYSNRNKHIKNFKKRLKGIKVND